ncbi:MAG TPA: hypothetical protein VGG75_13690 [Trebonia sp.]|jgi:hypothetical protein
MSEKEVLEECNGMRLVIALDPYPKEPYDDGQAPLLRIGCGSVKHIDGNSRPHEDDERVEEAVSRFGAPSARGWKLFEKYLQAFYGVTVIDTYYSGSYWYTSYDSKAWRDYAAGLPDNASSAGNLHLLDAWKAYVEGEVYTYAIEKLVTWTATELDYLDYPDRETWETVKSVGGYYGHEYACGAAREAWAAGGFAEQGGSPDHAEEDDYPEEKTRKDLA